MMKTKTMQLYKPDCDLPGLKLLFDTDALAERIRTWLAHDGEFKLSISNIRYKPQTSCLVSYSVETQRGTTYLHAKAFQNDDWKVRKQKFPETNDNHWVDDNLAVGVTRFPADSVLLGVESLIRDPQTFIERLVPQQHGVEKLAELTTLAYKPNRRFTARLDFESGQAMAIKIYEPDELGQVLETLESTKKIPFEFPRRLGKSQRHRAVVYQWLDGQTLDLSELTTLDVDTLMGSIFEYLDRLHGSFNKNTHTLAERNPTEGLATIAQYMGEIHPPSAKIARQICDGILSAQQSFHYKPELIHGDFHAHQILVRDKQISACDYDNCCLSDRTLDAANLLGHAQYRACLNQVTNDLVCRATEIAERHYESQAMAARLKWNQMASMFRLATNPFRSGSANWIEETEGLLQHVWREILLLRKSSGSLRRRQSGPSQQHSIQRRISNDNKFGFLNDALELSEANRILRRCLPALDRAVGPYEVEKINAKRHKPGRRCLIEYQLNTDRGSRAILGKASAKRLDRKALEIQSSLFEKHGFGYESTDGISVSNVLGFFAPWNMWFQDKIDAVPGIHFLDKTSLSAVTGQIADAISKLHSCGFCPTRLHTTSDELELLANRLTPLAVELPSKSPQIERILDSCAAICGELDDQLLVPIHRDFYHDQIMFADTRTYLVDLDLVSLGHPAIDVGNFLAHLTEQAIRVHGDPQYWQTEENQIADRYQLVNPSCTTEEILACKALSLARHIFISWQKPKRRNWTREIIDVAEWTCHRASHAREAK